MSNSNNKTSILVKSQVPDFVRADHALFVEFLEYYYKFLEQDGQLQYVTKNFQNFLDVDIIKQDVDHAILEGEFGNVNEATDYHIFLQKLYDNYTNLIPDSILADKTLLLKHAREFYRTRGTEKSIRFLMRALYNEEIEFYYPKTDILRASAGKWFVEKSLNVKDFAVNNVSNSTCYTQFVGRTIRGNTSNSTCTVEAADQYFDNGVLVTELKISAEDADFINGEQLFTFFEENGAVKFLSCNLFSGIILTTTVTNPGSGYVQGAAVPIYSNSGSGGQIIISKVSKANLEGKIKSVEVTYAGSGFRANDVVLFTGGAGGHGAAANVWVVQADDTYHPATYDIIGTRIIDVANVVIANTLNVNQGGAYSNMANIYVNTSNLLITTGTGPATSVNLNFWTGNSNVYFETGDYIKTNNEYVFITGSNTKTSIITVSPALSANLAAKSFVVYKKPNANSIMSQSFITWTYGPCGPILSVKVTNEGSGYRELPTLDVQSNTFIRSLGVLGRMDIIEGGYGYQNNDILEFVNQAGDYGDGANGVVTNVDANGAITQISFTARTGFNIGGMGYNQGRLPNVHIISANANAYGAVIQVTSILGDGELVEATSNVIGSVERLRIISGGAGYLTNPTLDLSTQGDGTATAIANTITGIYTYPGRYISDDGHLSGYNFIQDRDYYQPFSYVIKSDVSLNTYRKAIKDLSHPAGAKIFGQHIYRDQTAATDANAFANVVNSFVVVDSVYANLVVKLSTSNTLSYIPTGNFNQGTFDVYNGIFSNTGNIWYDSQNVWYNAANNKQSANLKGNTYFTSGGLRVMGYYANGNATMTHASSMNVANVITVSVWINQSNTTSYKVILSKQASLSRGFEFYMNTGNPNIYLRPGFANNILTYATGIPSNTWQHVAFTYDGAKIRGYSNGVFKAISTGTANSATDTAAALVLGGMAGYPAYNFEGKIASVEIYNKVLSNTEIQTLFNKDRRKYGI